MRIDRGHLRWGIVSCVLLLASAVWYAVYSARAPAGPSGGSLPGLTFGVVGSLFILFAALLGVRKKRPHYRLGRAATWLKGHLWLGTLSFPLILFHGGFSLGGAVTQVLMALFFVVFLTGAFGLVLQQFLPRLMTGTVVQETVYEQIDHVREQLLEEALGLAQGRKAGGAVARKKSGGTIQGRVVSGRTAVAAPEDERMPLIRFVERQMRPYFQRRGVVGKNDLSDVRKRAALFSELRTAVKADLQPAVDDLAALCDQREQLELQRRLHHWLHGWLLVHVPAAWAMVALSVVHAVMALSY